MIGMFKYCSKGMLKCNYKEEEVDIGMLTAVVVTVSILSLAWIVGEKEQPRKQ